MASATQNNSARGSALLAVSRIWAQASSAILFLATSVMISPPQFGEFAIATSIFLALAVGVGHGTYEYVMKARESDTAAPTSFFLNMGTASIASVAALALSLVVPHFVAGPHIGQMLTLLTPAFFLMGANVLMESVTLKRGQITKVAIASLVTETAGLIVALVALANGAGIMALVFQRLTREGVITLVYVFSDRWRPQIIFDVSEAKKAMGFARDIVTARFIQMGSVALVDVVIGAALSTADAGLFRLVSRLLAVGSDILFQPFRATLWVSLPPVQNDREAFGKTAFNLLEVFGVGLFAAMAGAALIVAPVFQLVLAPAWQNAVPVFYILAFARVLSIPFYIGEVIFALRNKTGFLAVSSLVATVLYVVAAFVAAPAGLYVMSVAEVVVTILSLLFMVPVMTKCADMPVSALLQLMGRLSLNAIAMIAVAGPWVVLGLRLGLDGWPLVASTVALGAVVYILAARRFTPAGYIPYADALAGALRSAQRLAARKRAG